MTLGQNSAGRNLKDRLGYLGLAMTAGLLLLAAQLYRLQIAHGDEYAARSVDNFVKKIRIQADRGMIMDGQGEILVDNRPSFDLFVTPAFCQSCADEVLPRLGLYLGWDADQLQHAKEVVRAGKLAANFQPVLIRIDLSRDELDVVNAHRMDLPGVEVLRVPHRNYRKGSVLAHLLGYMNEINQEQLDRLNNGGASYALGDYIGRRGIESYFESKLRGSDGLRKEVVNARGEPIPGLTELLAGEDPLPPQPGANIVLSIDSRLQEEAERVFPGLAGAAVVVEVETGFILAMVSRPSFDPNLLTGRVSASQMAALVKDPLQPLVFRPVAQHYSPGSTFKPVTALAALRSGVFGSHTTANCTGGYRFGSRFWRCWKDRGHGIVDARAALQHSCDTYYYRVADTLGLDLIAEMGTALGLGSPTGIGVVAEVPGVMPSTDYHNRKTPGGYMKGMALNSAIGQGDDNVTPLQLAMLYASLANGGNVYQPQVVRRVESVDGRPIEEFGPKLVRKVEIAPEHHKIVIDALAAVVNEPGGTAYSARLKDVKVAGKTGTAQVARLGSVRVKKENMDFWERDHAWFASFAPADAPEIAVVVLNEHGGHGASDAAPAAMAIIHKYFDLKKNEESPPTVERTMLSEQPPVKAYARSAPPSIR
jgi:penicillin-binding protein 2